MIRRSSIIAVFACVAALASTAQAAPVKPMTKAQAEAKARYFVNREKADRYQISDKVGRTFTVSKPFCSPTDAHKFAYGCSYYVTGLEPVETRADGTRVVRQCAVRVQVRKSRRSGSGRGKVTGRRLAPTCGTQEIPAGS